MAKNDGMDALGALLGLGILGAMASDGTKEAPPFIKEMQRQQAVANSKVSTDQPQQTSTLIAGAKEAKEIYNAYVTVGFTEAQAFELLKTVLSVANTK